jgi:hypothetical protein
MKTKVIEELEILGEILKRNFNIKKKVNDLKLIGYEYMTEDIELELNEIEHNGLILLMKIIRDEEK